MHNNPNLYLVNLNAYAKFCLIPSICSQNIQQKRGWNDKITDNLKTYD